MVAPQSKRSRRTWPQRLLIVFNCVCILGALGTAGTLGYFNKKVSEVTRIRLGNVLDDQKTTPGDPENYLLVGADDAGGLGAGDPETLGRHETSVRTDTIMILRIDPKDTTARLISFPRDLWVNIAGRPAKNRINTAIEAGNAQVLARTIEQDFGIQVHHYVQVDFASFKKLVGAIGGIPIYFPDPVRDRHSGLDVPTPGCHVLDPTQALAFARSRYFYIQKNGRWHQDPASDLGRISRQQFFIKTALQRAVKKGVRNPAKLRQLVNIGVGSVKIDERLTAEDFFKLGVRFRSFNPANLVTYTLPVDEAVKGAAQVLELRQAEAEPIFSIFRGEPASGDSPGAVPITPAEVKVRVLNGSGTSGQASQATQGLTARGFAMSSPGDTVASPDGHTTLRFRPDQLAKARLVARYLAGDVVFQATADLQGVDVEVVTAADWQGVLTTPKTDTQVASPSTAPTTTTAPPATTTTAVIGYVPTPPPPGTDCH